MKILPPNATKLFGLAAIASFLLAARGLAYDTTWTGASGDFFNLANWDTLVPAEFNTFLINNAGTAVIDTNTDVYFNYFDLGDLGTGSGNLVISNGIVHMAEDPGDSFSQVGLNTAALSSLIMYGGTNYFDGPQADVLFAKTGVQKIGNLWTNAAGNSGISQLQMLIGSAASSGAKGRLELHGNAVLRVARGLNFCDKTPVAPGFQQATLIMDGNAELSSGDGIAVCRDLGTTIFDLSGNARLVVGNTMGVGSTNGSSQQGFLTCGSRATSTNSITVRDNAEVHCMTLQNRANTTILVTNHAKLKIYNVLAGSGTIFFPGVDSNLGTKSTSGNGSLMTLADHGLLYVDTLGIWGGSATPVAWSNSVNGLTIGNGEFNSNVNGGSGDGGKGTLSVQDFATADIRQGLHLGTANNVASDGTLRVVGPNATVKIGGDLRLAINFTNRVATGTGRLEAVITGPAHSTVIVTNKAWLTNGVLKVTLQGYSPRGGETYTLVSAGTVDGLPKTNDLSAATLAPGLVWQVSATSTTLVLKVVNTFAIQKSSANIMVSWQNQGSTNILQSSTNVATNYSDLVPTAASPYTTSPTNSARFFRLRR